MSSQKKSPLLTLSLLIAISISALCLFAPLEQYLSMQQARLSTAISLLISYGLFYFWIQQGHQSHRQTPETKQALKADDILIIYASQTGYAEQLAIQTQSSLQQGGMQTHVCNISELDAQQLQQTHKMLVIASTTGEGDAPDSAATFSRNLLNQTLSLTHCRYAVLALGDRNYQAFCAFGHQLDQWLHQQGAERLFDTVEVDNGDDGALRHWQHHLGLLSGNTALPDWHDANYETWTLTARQLLNPGSQGDPVYQVRLTPAQEHQWQAGDIAEISPQRPGIGEALPHREYSIASLPCDGGIDLIVRQMHQADGSLGLGSGWLCHYADIGSEIRLRLRQNRSFHPPTHNCPLILIGNGTGIAGLRALLKHRAKHSQHQNWLFFGERHRAHDYFCQSEIEQWHATGVLSKIDLAFSRDQEQRVYVQDKLREQASALADWVNQGAAIYVCGSLEGMAGGVDHVLRDILGDAKLEKLREEGRYRRDVY